MLSSALPRPIPPQNASSRNNNNNSNGSSSSQQANINSAAWKNMTPKRERSDNDDVASTNGQKSKKAKRKGGKACVYCRRRCVLV
jgi:hypothetical protein